MAKVTITIQENALGGAKVAVSPTPEVLNAAAGGRPLTPAETYALGALNYIRENQDGIANLPAVRKPRMAFRSGMPVRTASIILEDRGNGAACHASPTFNDLARLAAGGTEMTTTHATALAALGRIVQMGRLSKGGRKPGEAAQ